VGHKAGPCTATFNDLLCFFLSTFNDLLCFFLSFNVQCHCPHVNDLSTKFPRLTFSWVQCWNSLLFKRNLKWRFHYICHHKPIGCLKCYIWRWYSHVCIIDQWRSWCKGWCRPMHYAYIWRPLRLTYNCHLYIHKPKTKKKYKTELTVHAMIHNLFTNNVKSPGEEYCSLEMGYRCKCKNSL
jgi:hypothetical protein